MLEAIAHKLVLSNIIATTRNRQGTLLCSPFMSASARLQIKLSFIFEEERTYSLCSTVVSFCRNYQDRKTE